MSFTPLIQCVYPGSGMWSRSLSLEQFLVSNKQNFTKIRLRRLTLSAYTLTNAHGRYWSHNLLAERGKTERPERELYESKSTEQEPSVSGRRQWTEATETNLIRPTTVLRRVVYKERTNERMNECPSFFILLAPLVFHCIRRLLIHWAAFHLLPHDAMRKHLRTSRLSFRPSVTLPCFI